MAWIVQNLWLIPASPLAAAGLIAVMKRPQRTAAASLTIGTMFFSFLLALCAFAHVVHPSGDGNTARQYFNFDWLQMGSANLQLGWVLDPLTAVMLVMVTFVGLLIFIYSVGYMAHDENFTRFFCFLSLFAAAMLGIVIANSLLLLFVNWELVGLASYLLIGFWYQKPSAAAAAKKAFITTRIGDVLFFLGMLWLYADGKTLLFYADHGKGCLEADTLTNLAKLTTTGGLALNTAIGLLIFGGAMGKSGQVPLHVWLPDAMEGPTPVSALIHAATMVAAGVFLIARVFPLMAGTPETFPTILSTGNFWHASPALHVVTWVGAITALFAACIAVAQTDIKRILAYSTVSQLGYMFMGLGAGGVSVGMFHLITHAFFKALLFLGAGSVIHGCHEEQDIRKMGGIRKYMPWTFATYAVGMMALSGVPLLFSGFWSKDGILESLQENCRGPFYLGVAGAFLTAFYMTRQMCYVFAGDFRGNSGHHEGHSHEPHESPPVMTWPLLLLAIGSVVLGFFGTPAWPWFKNFLSGFSMTHVEAEFDLGRFFDFGHPFDLEKFLESAFFLMLVSTLVVLAGIRLGWAFYGGRKIDAEESDAIERLPSPVFGDVFTVLQNKFYVDEFYEWTVIRFNRWWADLCSEMDRWLWGGIVFLIGYAVIGLAWLDRVFDEFVINLGFDRGCDGVNRGGRFLSRLQNGRVQDYLRVIGVALAALALLLIWGCSAS